MKKNRTVAIICLVLLLLLGGAYALYQNLAGDYAPDQLATDAPQATAAPGETGAASDESTEPQLQQAPDFTVYDIDGNPVKLSDFFGKPIVLNFWASWCGPCRMEMPDFDAKAKELEGKVHFLMVNVTDGGRETVETASAFIAEQGFEFPVFYDTDMMASNIYGAYSLPTTYFIDADGNGIAHAKGSISEEILQKGIDMIYSAE